MTNKGLLLINLGSPDSYEVKDVKTYLRQFLMDGKVIDAPYLVRKMIVEGFVLPFRPKKSAAAYRSVWMKEGAPLKVFTEQFRQALMPLVNDPLSVAMRYANPSPIAGLKDLENQNPLINEIWLAPLYPHFAMSSFETAYEYAMKEIRKVRPDMKFKILQPFYNEDAYIAAIKNSIAPYLMQEYDLILFSYHGLPVRHLKKSDPTMKHCYLTKNCCDVPSPAWDFCYKHQVIRTTQLVAAQLGIPGHKYKYSFQSRLGNDQWIKPYTKELLEKLPAQGIKRLLVVCPAFVSDCLETLEEMGLRGNESFVAAGGESFTLIPCLNSNTKWVEAFAGYYNDAGNKYAKLWN